MNPGRMLALIPVWFTADTRAVLRRELTYPGFNVVARGNPWIDSPIFDRLAGERFGK